MTSVLSSAVVLLFCNRYADRPDLPTTLPAGCNATAYAATSLTYQPRWDTWARVFQTVIAKIPFLHANGNHVSEACAAVSSSISQLGISCFNTFTHISICTSGVAAMLQHMLLHPSHTSPVGIPGLMFSRLCWQRFPSCKCLWLLQL